MEKQFKNFITEQLEGTLQAKSFAYDFNPVIKIIPKNKLIEFELLANKLDIEDYRILPNDEDTRTIKIQMLYHYHAFDEEVKQKYQAIKDMLLSISTSARTVYISEGIGWIDKIYTSVDFCSTYFVIRNQDLLAVQQMAAEFLQLELLPIIQGKDFSCMQIAGVLRGYKNRASKLGSYLLRSNIPYASIEDRDGYIQYSDVSIRLYDNQRQSAIGYRDDLRLIFNSTWEANLARILESLHIPFEYEAKKFYMDNDGSNLTYIPDFFLSSNTILEVKGFWDFDSLKKVSLFKEQHSEYNLKIIDYDMYYDLVQLFKDKVEHWEEGTCAIKSEKVYVVGVQRPERKKAVEAIAIKDEVFLIREPNNHFDKNAIAVYNKNNQLLGYIRKDYASIYAEKIDIGFVYQATVVKKEKSAITIKVIRTNTDKHIVHELFNQSVQQNG